MRADNILDQIDSALEDWTVSDDAMRSRPAPEPSKPQLWIAPVGTPLDGDGWQPLGGIRDIGLRIGPPTIDPEFVRQWAEFQERIIRVRVEQARQVQTAFEVIAEWVRQRLIPAAQQAARDAERAMEACEKAGICDDHGRPLPPRDRPAWQSRYGPAHQRRRR